MKSIYNSILALVLVLLIPACKKDFGKINTDPNNVTIPDVRFLLSYSENSIVTYQGTEWIWESFEHLFRYSQLMTSDPYELSTNVNTRYRAYYTDILPNLFEIRKQIDAAPDAAEKQNMKAITYILQILHGLKVTDMNGAIPYSEANRGRNEGDFSPVYDPQQTLFDTWLQELDNSIATLGAGSSGQQTYGNADIFYQSDRIKWIKLANTLKLRIAVRYENQDNNKAKEIFRSVMQDATGPIDSEASQLEYLNPDYIPFSPSDINYRSTRYGTIPLINFMKQTNDPRLKIYFEPNSLTGSYADTLAKYGQTLPAFINPADPLIAYQGGPVDFTTNPTIANYIKNPFPVGPNNYFLISPVNRKFFSPRLNNENGNFLYVLVSFAETCFYIAEFIEKGYGDGIDTKGTSEDWYRKGIASSIRTMNRIAVEAGSTPAYTDEATGDALINDYLNDPLIVLDGTNDLERIYIQQYLNFFRLANEAFTFVRRTGYPKKSSTYYPWEIVNEIFPRRFWLDDPGPANRDNWQTAQEAQGITAGDQTVQNLNSQRLWFDIPSPDFGEGN